MPLILTDFSSLRPRYESPQSRALEWLASAHAKAGKKPGGASRPRMQALLARYGCGPDDIRSRGHELEDFLHSDWARMAVYTLEDGPRGAGMEARTLFYSQAVDRVFEELYPPSAEAPDDLIHVTCTGYCSPSGAQKLAARRGWGERTRVTHAYHMGCYASIPAVRMAAGFLRRSSRVDIVHTELCSLHLNCELREPEQLVIQSLFADGFIRYSARPVRTGQKAPSGLRLLAAEEYILPESAELMGWHCADWGMRMRLSREVPARIEAALGRFLGRLSNAAGVDWSRARSRAAFAVHPGGPKILDAVQARLSLCDDQIAASRSALARYGNMSSATLPHIWADLLRDPNVATGRLIFSLAFGPGLTLCGAVFRKI